MPLLTVGIPIYNCEDFIQETLQNVFNELKTLEDPVEIVLCDNASTDNTQQKILAAIQQIKPEIQTLNLPIDLGKGNVLKFFPNATNLGMDKNVFNCIKNATGKFVHIHSADDYYMQGGLKRLVECIKTHPDGTVICLSNAYLNTFNNQLIYCNATDDEDAHCKNLNEFITHEQLKLLCLSNAVLRREDILRLKSVQAGFGLVWMHLYLTQQILQQDSTGYCFGFNHPVMVVRFGNQGWVKKGAIAYFYRALCIYNDLRQKGLTKPQFNKLKKHFLNGVINPQTQKSDRFFFNVVYALKYFPFYWPNIRQWLKFSGQLIFAPKQDFFHGMNNN